MNVSTVLIVMVDNYILVKVMTVMMLVMIVTIIVLLFSLLLLLLLRCPSLQAAPLVRLDPSL